MLKWWGCHCWIHVVYLLIFWKLWHLDAVSHHHGKTDWQKDFPSWKNVNVGEDPRSLITLFTLFTTLSDTRLTTGGKAEGEVKGPPPRHQEDLTLSGQVDLRFGQWDQRDLNTEKEWQWNFQLLTLDINLEVYIPVEGVHIRNQSIYINPSRSDADA